MPTNILKQKRAKFDSNDVLEMKTSSTALSRLTTDDKDLVPVAGPIAMTRKYGGL